MGAKKIKEIQKKEGVLASTSHSQLAAIDKLKCYKKRKSPD